MSLQKKNMQMTQAKLRLKCLNMQTKKYAKDIKRQFNVTSVPKNTIIVIIYYFLLYYPSLEGIAILLQSSNFFYNLL